MSDSVGHLSATLGEATMSSPAPADSYFGVAEQMMPGVAVLAAASPLPAMALALVSAHVLECLLKASISRASPRATTDAALSTA
jgi:hypothetical protein